MRKFLAELTLVITIVFVPASYACTCGGPPRMSTTENLSAVFSGVLESIVDHRDARLTDPGAGLVEYVFKVGQVWKGPQQSTISVFSDKSSCGAWFEYGKLYFVCVHERGVQGSILRTDLCMSGPFERALVARVMLADPVVVDAELAQGRPDISQLERLVNSIDLGLAREAVVALESLRSRKTDVPRRSGEP